MRKLSLLIALAVFSLSAIAQYNGRLEEPVNAKAALTKSEKSFSQKVAKNNLKAVQAITPFWSEGFDNGLPEGWTNTDDAGFGGWMVSGNQMPPCFFSNESKLIYGENAPEGNQFLHFPMGNYNSVQNAAGEWEFNQSDAKVFDGTIETDWIDITGHSYVSLRFTTWFYLWNDAKFDINITTDGNNWTTLNGRVINGSVVDVNSAPIQQNPNGHDALFEASLTDIVGGATQMKMQFRIHGCKLYFASIDNIELFEPLSNDIDLVDVYAGNGEIYTTSATLASGNPTYRQYNTNYSEVPYNLMNQLQLGGLLNQKGIEATNARLEIKMDSLSVADYKIFNSTTTIPSFSVGKDSILYSDTTNFFQNSPVFYSPDLSPAFFAENNLMDDGIEYLFKYEALSDNEDLETSNNKGYIPYAQTQGRYSYHHQPTFNDSVKYHDIISNGMWMFNTATGDAVLNDFSINSDNPVKIYGVRAYISKSTDYNTYDANGYGVTITPVAYFLDVSTGQLQVTKIEGIMNDESVYILTPEHKGKWLFMPFDAEKVNQFDFQNGMYRIGFQIEDYNLEQGNSKNFSIAVDESVRQASGHCSYFAEGKFYGMGLKGSLMIDVYTSLEQFEYDQANSTVVKPVVNATNNVKVYPNPTNGIINIANAENASVEVYTITGTLVRSIERAAVNTSVNLSNLSKGTYLVKIVKDNQVVTKKVNLLK